MDNALNSTIEMSQAELIFQLAKTNVEQEKRLKSTEMRLSVLEEEVKKLSKKAVGEYGCSTMSAYVQRHKLPIYVSDISKLGNDATRLCRKRGVSGEEGEHRPFRCCERLSGLHITGAS